MNQAPTAPTAFHSLPINLLCRLWQCSGCALRPRLLNLDKGTFYDTTTLHCLDHILCTTGTIITSTALPLSALLSPHPDSSIKRQHTAVSGFGEEQPPRTPKSPRGESGLELANVLKDSPDQPEQTGYTFTAPPAPARHAAQAQRMRSSIACVRCRRSKVKCVNNGINTTCRACESSGRECAYPEPVSGGKRRDSSFSGPSGHVDDAGDGEVWQSLELDLVMGILNRV